MQALVDKESSDLNRSPMYRSEVNLEVNVFLVYVRMYVRMKKREENLKLRWILQLKLVAKLYGYRFHRRT